MLFNSFTFPPFLALVALLTFVAPARQRGLVLLIASLYFYAIFNVTYVALLVAAILVAYFGALGISRAATHRARLAVLLVAVVVQLSGLFVFKYFDFFTASLDAGLRANLLPHLGLLVPAGLSFFTFSCASYLIDVFRRTIPAERNFVSLSLYVSFFPKLLAGPIERASHFLPQLERGARFDPEGVTIGLQLILWGLFKKVVIADRLAAIVNNAYQSPAFVSPVELLLATYFFAFQIYCDFSGYSDIAIGAARVLGFDLIENFRRPYLSTSITEFWAHRWHISLTRWFRDYVYIPLGGSRVTLPRLMLNLMIVFVVSGLWHGANWTFVVWGALNGLYQVLYLLSRRPRAAIGAVLRLPRWLAGVLSALLTFHVVVVAWVFFRAASLQDASTILTRIVTAAPRLPDLLRSYPFNSSVVLAVGLIGFLLVVELIEERQPIWQALRVRPVYQRWAVYYVLLAALIVLGSWNLSQFVYMQF